MEKKQNSTEILGLRDKEIQTYLKSHPKKAEKLANILVNLEVQRKKDNKLASSIGALGYRTRRWYGVIPDKEYFHQPKHLVIFILLFILILIFTVTFLASLFYNF